MNRKFHFALLFGILDYICSCSGNNALRYQDIPEIDAHIHGTNPDNSEYINSQLSYTEKQNIMDLLEEFEAEK